MFSGKLLSCSNNRLLSSSSLGPEDIIGNNHFCDLQTDILSTFQPYNHSTFRPSNLSFVSFYFFFFLSFFLHFQSFQRNIKIPSIRQGHFFVTDTQCNVPHTHYMYIIIKRRWNIIIWVTMTTLLTVTMMMTTTMLKQASDCLTRRRPQVHCAHNRHQPRPGRGEIFIFIMILRLLCHNRIKGGVNSC